MRLTGAASSNSKQPTQEQTRNPRMAEISRSVADSLVVSVEGTGSCQRCSMSCDKTRTTSERTRGACGIAWDYALQHTAVRHLLPNCARHALGAARILAASIPAPC